MGIFLGVIRQLLTIYYLPGVSKYEETLIYFTWVLLLRPVSLLGVWTVNGYTK